MSVDLEIGADGIAVLTLTRPGFGNAFDLEAATEFNARVLECERDRRCER
jgi:enoyl-CoA hydratase/carnithine racemase